MTGYRDYFQTTLATDIVGRPACSAVKTNNIVDDVTFAEKVANRIRDLGLTAPAIFLLEAHKPLAFIGSQLLLVAQPTLDLILPPHLTKNTVDLFADPNQLERLISALETGVSFSPSPDDAPPAKEAGS